MWQFFSEHTVLAAVMVFSVFLIAIIFAIIFTKKGIEKIDVGKDGVSFSTKSDKGKTPEEIISETVVFCNRINRYNMDIFKQLEINTNNTVSECIEHSTKCIDLNIQKVRLEYFTLLKETKAKITPEDNYQTLIYGFLLDQISEYFKDEMCTLIRKDQLNSKKQEELDLIGENCFLEARRIFEEKIDFLNRDILEKVAFKYEKIVKNCSNNIIELTKAKYNELLKLNTEYMENKERELREELKLNFPQFSEKLINNLIKYSN